MGLSKNDVTSFWNFQSLSLQFHDLPPDSKSV
jgi:hypothetical protein